VELMRARRVAIMLLLTALSALTLFFVVLLGGTAEASAPAAPDSLLYCRDQLVVGPDGGALATVTVVLGRVSSMDLLLPWTEQAGRDHQIVRGPAVFGVDAAGAPLPVVDVLGTPHWNLRLLPGAAPGDTIAVGAFVPGWYDPAATLGEFGVHRLGRRWVNTSRFTVAAMELGLALPPGMLVDEVGATTPGFNAKKSPEPPYAITREGGRDVFVITARDVAPAGRTAFALDARPARRGRLPLIVGLLLAAAYLISFRDVLRPAARS
jgi:hypothetical protein